MKIGWIQAAALATYPPLVYIALHWLPVAQGAALLLGAYAAILLLRTRHAHGELRPLLIQHLPLLMLIGVAIGLQDRRLLLMLPTLVNLYLLLTFARSLWNGRPMIERFARMIEDDLPEFTHPYCRKLTQLWCLFFGANAAAITYLAFAAPIEWWTLYTGFLFYLLLAFVQAAEFVVRKLWFRHYNGGFLDHYFERFFPAARTANGRRSLAYQAARGA